MNLIVGLPLWLTILLGLALAAAATEDAVRLRISNLSCALVFISAIVAMALHGFSWSLWQNVVVFAAILAVGTIAFSAGLVGGGDVKLFAAVGLWVDLKTALGLVAAISICGGVLAVAYLGFSAVRGRSKVRGRARRVPYGLAIVGGAAFIMALQLMHQDARPTPYRLPGTNA
jgi:prepilin peptidase CpaA